MKTIEIKIDAEELKAICKEYEFVESEAVMGDDLMYKLKKALSLLDRADYVIWCIYLHFGSERKTAEILGCSRTPIHKCIVRIKEEILRWISLM